MPKNKTHSGAKKRFRVTGTGKIMHMQVNQQHKFEEKTARRVRRLAQDQVVAPQDLKKIKRLLGK